MADTGFFTSILERVNIEIENVYIALTLFDSAGKICAKYLDKACGLGAVSFSTVGL
jgi:hypothetical protein